MTPALWAWVLSPILGLASVLFALIIVDRDLLELSSYKDVLASLYFVAIGTNALGCADAFELALRRPRTRAQDSEASRLMVMFISSLVYLLFLVAMFARALQKGNNSNSAIAPMDLGIVSVCIVFAVAAGFFFKAQLIAQK